MKLRNPRKIAWMAVGEFEKKHGDPDEILDNLIDPAIDERDRALAWEITKGTIRYLKKLDYIAQTFVKAPITKQKPTVLSALRIGLYQLTQMSSVPQFAAVDQTVKLIADESMKRDAGFVNAILRSYLREPDKVKYPDPTQEPVKYLAALYSYPEWLVQRWLTRFGYIETMQMLIANNEHHQTFFKVINTKIERQSVLDELNKEDEAAEPGKYFPDYIAADDGKPIIGSRLFREGYLMVQDQSQGLPIYLLDPRPGAEVLDLCSAPGGKTIALADKVGPNGKVISLDKDQPRLELVRQNAGRIGFENIEYIAGDLFEFAPGKKFKYILLDVPCSGLGTISQNADMRWTKKEQDIKTLAHIQRRMLEKAVNLLADGGRLVYSTCTTEPEEIEGVINGFLKSNPKYRLGDEESGLVGPFVTKPGIFRTWPHKHGIGGGGFALLEEKR